MATIAVQPIVLKDVLLTVGTDNYEAHVSEVVFEPSTSIQTWQGLTPTATFTDATGATWTCKLTFAQDWATANSLSKYLFDNEGTTKAVKFKPKKPATGTAPTWSATVVIVPGSIGGTVNTFATASVVLGVQGKPALTVE